MVVDARRIIDGMWGGLRPRKQLIVYFEWLHSTGINHVLAYMESVCECIISGGYVPVDARAGKRSIDDWTARWDHVATKVTSGDILHDDSARIELSDILNAMWHNRIRHGVMGRDVERLAEIGRDVALVRIGAEAEHGGFAVAAVAETSRPGGPQPVIESGRSPSGALIGAAVEGDHAIEDARVDGAVELEQELLHVGAREMAGALVSAPPEHYLGLNGCLAVLAAAITSLTDGLLPRARAMASLVA